MSSKKYLQDAGLARLLLTASMQRGIFCPSSSPWSWIRFELMGLI